MAGRRSHVWFLIGSMLALAGCTGPKAYVRPGLLDHPPRRVAVLPFVITYPYDLAGGQEVPEGHTTARDALRATFARMFAPLGYEDVPLTQVDETLAARWGAIEAGGWKHASAQDLGQALGADALIYGDVNRIVQVASPLYTDSSLDASLRMVDARLGEVLWRQRVKLGERGGALMQKGQVVDFFKDQARSYQSPAVKFQRVADMAAWRALKEFPDPPMRMESSTPSAQTGSAARLAVLPFEASRKGWLKAATHLRRHVAAGLQDGPFAVVELRQVEAALQQAGWTEGDPLPADLSDVARRLDADGFLRGTVTAWGRTYLVVQSWVTAALRVELVDARRGTVVWSDEERDTRQAGLLKGPTGLKSIATAPLKGLKTSHLERVAMHVGHDVAEELSQAPAVLEWLRTREDAGP